MIGRGVWYRYLQGQAPEAVQHPGFMWTLCCYCSYANWHKTKVEQSERNGGVHLDICIGGSCDPSFLFYVSDPVPSCGAPYGGSERTSLRWLPRGLLYMTNQRHCLALFCDS
jgi:hypothetical protein